MKRLYIGRTSGDSYWVDRDKYKLGTKKSDWHADMGFEETELYSFCQPDFEAITGIKLKPGEIRRVKIEVILI